MTVNQIYSIVNASVGEILGETAVLAEDLSNVVDIGTAIFNANGVDNYVKSLVQHIGKVIFVNRKYSGNVPNVLMDGWEFGCILEKIDIDMPTAETNASWALVNGQSYDPNIFYQPTVHTKFYGDKLDIFDIPVSISERTVKQSFSNAEQLNSFVSGIYTSVENALTVRIDNLVMMLINNMIAETINDDYGSAGLGSKSGIKAVNLLYLYNSNIAPAGETITADECLHNPEFMRFASYTMATYANRLTKISTLFNIDGRPRFTSSDRLNWVMLADFASATKAYLASDTFHEQFVALPNADLVPFWQGSGTDYGFDSITAINVKTASGVDVVADGILAVMFDHDAVAVCNKDRRVTTNYNPKAEFYSNWYKFDCQYMADTAENFVVFFVA